MPTAVLVTGASGRVGSAIRTHLADDYELTGLDVDPGPDDDAVVADITDYDEIRPAFDGQDAVVHLAGEPSPSAAWERVHRLNLLGTYNVLEAARDAGVSQVVFASTNHVVGGYPDFHEGGLEPGHDLSVDHTDPVRPDSYYAVTKLFGETLGRYYVEYMDAPEQFYAARIGWVLGPEYDSPYGPAERGVDRGEYERGSEAYRETVARARTLWCSRRDMARFVDCALRDDAVSFDAFGVRSAGERQWLDVEHARRVLGFDPVDDADAAERPV
jgi:nucleoside-diphosphate-sugar epimerase